MKKLITLSTLALSCFAANAELRINGFANLVGGLTSSDESVYGYNDKTSFNPESLFAIQMSGDINSKMSATGQMVARGRNDYDPAFEWAYLTYQASDRVSISAGRLRLPLFKYSASKDVGYSYHWVTAPRAVYDVSFNNLDGFRFDYSNYAGDWEYNLQAGFGTVSNDLNTAVGPARLQVDNLALISAEAVYNYLKLRASYVTSKASISNTTIDGTIGGLRQAGLDALANNIAFTDDTATFTGIGLEYDTFNWFIGGEWTEIRIDDSFFPTTTSFYITAGFRSGKWTPSVTYEKQDANNPFKFIDQVAGLPTPIQPVANAVLVGLQQPFVEENNLLSAAIRYDYDTNVALKADISKYTDDIDDMRDATLLRFAVNYVF
ncbi:MAG: topoisomerase IV [Paraglaciecola sp.]|nr:topoisomerase IV [Paraglaciecola sp.]NCT48421.1 topoisomerase IV [Paraglaciecola sp.]